MSNLEAYQESMSEYRRFRACRKFQAALTALDHAIANAPIDEALPTLAAWREELEPLTRPVPVWKQWLGWQG